MKYLDINTKISSHPADMVTPVGLFLNLRARFNETLLFESSDYHTSENSFSYIVADPIATIELSEGTITETFPDRVSSNYPLKERFSNDKDKISRALRSFLSNFKVDLTQALPKGVINGLFGYLSYDAIPYSESITFREKGTREEQIPEMRYTFYRYLYVIDHYSQLLHVVENTHPQLPKDLALDPLHLATTSTVNPNRFKLRGDISSLQSDDEFISIVGRCKYHIARGDVFQIVPSRKFSVGFSGDTFQVYRQLRRVNPSPYLFFCDYQDFKLIGSSPEAQLVVRDGRAIISPIAGTYRRSGDDEEDSIAMKKLSVDPKETAEHVMLVDLARNDLSIYCYPVKVDRYKELQLYSHVMHLVSHVSGELKDGVDPLAVFAATFPAGTLSGAPKFKAMEIIDNLEPVRRNFYAGAVGCISLNGESNHAIIIRSLLAKGSHLYLQAGAGIVSESDPRSELSEVNNKLAAVIKACRLAEEL